MMISKDAPRGMSSPATLRELDDKIKALNLNIVSAREMVEDDPLNEKAREFVMTAIRQLQTTASLIKTGNSQEAFNYLDRLGY